MADAYLKTTLRADGDRVLADGEQLVATVRNERDARTVAHTWNCHDPLVDALLECVLALLSFDAGQLTPELARHLAKRGGDVLERAEVKA